MPNEEVRELFIDLVKDWFKETSRADWSRIERFCTAFPKGMKKIIKYGMAFCEKECMVVMA